MRRPIELRRPPTAIRCTSRSGRRRSGPRGVRSWSCTASRAIGLVSPTGADPGRGRVHRLIPRSPRLGGQCEDRGHTPSAGRLIGTWSSGSSTCEPSSPGLPIALAGISWGGKLAVIVAARHPELVDALALICPGLHPRVGVSRQERLRIAWAFLTNRRKTFPIPLSDPALFTANPEGQAFIAADPLGLREGTAGLLAASFIIDRLVGRSPGRIRQPALLMLAGQDRIVDNGRTLAYFRRLATRTGRSSNIPRGITPWNSTPIRRATPGIWSPGSIAASRNPRWDHSPPTIGVPLPDGITRLPSSLEEHAR